MIKWINRVEYEAHPSIVGWTAFTSTGSIFGFVLPHGDGWMAYGLRTKQRFDSEDEAKSHLEQLAAAAG